MFHPPNTITQQDDRVKINVRGTFYETHEATLCQYPNTLLGNRDQRNQFFDWRRNEYYFDCQSEIFDAILFFYQSSGILARPSFCSQTEYEKQLRFFGLAREKPLPPKPKNFKGKVWLYMEHPHVNNISLFTAYFSFLVIVCSVAIFCMESEIEEIRSKFRSRTIWFYLECFFIGYFSIEYLIRLYSSPHRWKFFKSFFGMIDLIAVLPFYFTLIIRIFDKNFTSHSYSSGMIRVLRLVQMLRIVKLSRYSTGLRVLGKSLVYCQEQLTSLGMFFMINVIFISSIVYLFEHESNEAFNSIPESMWFTIITMTTVGYGDVVPKTIGGKLTSVVSIFMGAIVLFHLFLPIYLMYFSIFYTKAQKQRSRREAEKKCAKKRRRDTIRQAKELRKLRLIEERTRELSCITKLDEKIEEIELTVPSRHRHLIVLTDSDPKGSVLNLYQSSKEI